MKFSVSSDLSYEVYSPTTFVFNIHVANNNTQQVIEETLVVSPELDNEQFIFKNSDTRLLKIQVPQGSSLSISYRATVEVAHRELDENDLLPPIPVMQLDHEVLPFLFPSRHCQSDKMRTFARKQFGSIKDEFTKVLAINDWVFNHTDYITGVTNSGTSAYDTLIQREGVCKDFAHLGIALCRASEIPARYFTGYAYHLNPPDFHACFEAYIGGHWVFCDPTRLAPLNGMVKIANSKDAAEAAVANFFGNAYCSYLNVQCTAETGFEPALPLNLDRKAVTYQ